MPDHTDDPSDRLAAVLAEQYDDLLPAGLVRSVVDAGAEAGAGRDEVDRQAATEADVAALAAAVLRSRAVSAA